MISLIKLISISIKSQNAATLPVGQPAAHPVAEQPIPLQEPEPVKTLYLVK